MERQILLEWKYSFATQKDLFLSFLIIELCQRVQLMVEVEDIWTRSDTPFNLLKLKGAQSRSLNRRKMMLKVIVVGPKRVEG